jgi:hypothetical protein
MTLEAFAARLAEDVAQRRQGARQPENFFRSQ